MSLVTPNWPAKWDGSTPNRDSADQNKKPDYRDWDQMYAEVKAMQEGLPIGGAGGAAGTGVTAENFLNPIVKTVISIVDLAVAMVDAGAAGAHGSAPLFTFPNGNIAILGATTDLAVVAGVGGIGDTGEVVGAIGSVATATDNATLTSTEADIVPSTAATLSGGIGAMDGESTALAVLNGVSSAPVARLNLAVPDAGSSADDTLTVNGTVTITWTNLGDN